MSREKERKQVSDSKKKKQGKYKERRSGENK